MISSLTLRSKVVLIAVLIGSVPALAPAHDFWIEPSTFRPKVGENVQIALRVGQDFLGDAVPRSSQLFESFVIRDAAKQWPVNGFENDDPAGLLRIERDGVAVVSYRSKANPLELPANKFEEFLKQEGAEEIAALRAARGETAKPDREQFFRYAKTWLRTGEGATLRAGRVPGFRYDIVPMSNPWSNEPLRVRVLLDDKPVAGALVKALHRDDANARLSVRTDAKGTATLALPRAGVWLIESVQVVPAPASSGVDWESLWASVTFER